MALRRRPAVPLRVQPHSLPHAAASHQSVPRPASHLIPIHLLPGVQQQAQTTTTVPPPDSSGGGGAGYPSADTADTGDAGASDSGAPADDTSSDDTGADAALPAPVAAVSAPTLPAPAPAVSLYEIAGAALGGVVGYWGLGALVAGPVGLVVGAAAGALAGHLARGKGQANATT